VKPVISAIVGICVVLGIGLFISRGLKAESASSKTQYKLARVERGQVKKTVSATGVLQPWRIVDIKSKAGGRVDALLVDTGSVVKKGQVLAKIDPTDTLLSYNTARADIDSANARRQQNEVAYRLQLRQSDIAIANARAQVNAAKASLAAAQVRLRRAEEQAKAQPDMTSASVRTAEANYNSAVKQLNQLRMATHPQERAQAQAAVDQANANVKNALANLNRQRNLLDKGFVSQQVVDQAQATYDVAAAQLSSARKKLETLDEEHRIAIETQEARVAQAKAQWDSARAQEVDVPISLQAVEEARAAVAQSRAQLAAAEESYKQAVANKRNNEMRRLDIATAEAQIARSKATLVNAQATLDQTVVRAPTDGVILKKYVEEGTIISSALSFAATGNNILQLGDITQMYVDVTVDETDIANVDVGQMVELNIEAFPGIPFEGKVTRIDPQAQVEQNVTTIHVRVEVDNSAPTFRLLKPGMNATCEFVVDKRDDVILVPAEAVRSEDTGKFVEVGRGGRKPPPDPKAKTEPDPDALIDVKIEKRTVEVGLEGNDTVEITSGLKEGEMVVTQTIEPTPTTGSPFGGQRGPTGIRGGR